MLFLLLLLLLLLLLSNKSNSIFVNDNCIIGSNANRNRLLISLKGGYGSGLISNNNDDNDDSSSSSNDIGNDDTMICISGSPISKIDGIYKKIDNINGRSHYEKSIFNDPNGNKLHLYWSGSQWQLHYDLPTIDQSFDKLVGYTKIKKKNPIMSSSWYIKVGKEFESVPKLLLTNNNNNNNNINIKNDKLKNVEEALPEVLGIPIKLLPLYLSFMLDSIATGLAMPLLPFYIMELGANAFQLSLVISSNYVAQAIGCIIMGRISDKYGRKIVLLCCLTASFVSYSLISRARSVIQVTAFRIISGIFGGLLPIIQSSVADVSNQLDRPKYLGRIMATFGLGFVLGPALSAVCSSFSTRDKIQLSALLPLIGLLIASLFFKETKNTVLKNENINSKVIIIDNNLVNKEVLYLILNGFLIMYAFGTETIYAMFIKDRFGYGERTLSTLFACNGLFIGLFQIFLIRPLINRIGKHATLMVGNILLCLGMIGVALIRKEVLHFLLFSGHIIGYSIADTALVSLISRYSSPNSQGRDLSFNQAAQSVARVLSPLVSGLLYEQSKKSKSLPLGALPFLIGSFFPALAIIIPSILYCESISKKQNRKV